MIKKSDFLQGTKVIINSEVVVDDYSKHGGLCCWIDGQFNVNDIELKTGLTLTLIGEVKKDYSINNTGMIAKFTIDNEPRGIVFCCFWTLFRKRVDLIKS